MPDKIGDMPDIIVDQSFDMLSLVLFYFFSLMSLFEAGILDRMSSIEYEKMFGVQNVKITGVSTNPKDDKTSTNDNEATDTEPVATQKTNTIEKKAQKLAEINKLEPISIQMLQGAFLLLVVGYILALIILGLEIMEHRYGYFKEIGSKMTLCRSFLRKQFRKA